MAGLPWELLFAHYLVLIASSFENVKFRWWENNMESRYYIRMNVSKTKVIISSADSVPVLRGGVWPYSVFMRGVGTR